MGGSSLPQKVVFAFMCVAVLILLAPYAGCHVDRFNSEDSSAEHTAKSATSAARQEQKRGDEVEREELKPLGQIEDLLSN